MKLVWCVRSSPRPLQTYAWLNCVSLILCVTLPRQSLLWYKLNVFTLNHENWLKFDIKKNYLPGVSACVYCYEYPVYYPDTPPSYPYSAPPPCPDCAIMTMTTPYHPRPPRPTNLPGLQPMHACRGRHDSPNYSSAPPTLTTPVHMHPDPQDITFNPGFVFLSILIFFIFYFSS